MQIYDIVSEKTTIEAIKNRQISSPRAHRRAEGRRQRAEGFDGAEVLTAAKICSCSFAPAPKSKIGKTKEGRRKGIKAAGFYHNKG